MENLLQRALKTESELLEQISQGRFAIYADQGEIIPATWDYIVSPGLKVHLELHSKGTTEATERNTPDSGQKYAEKKEKIETEVPGSAPSPEQGTGNPRNLSVSNQSREESID